MPLKTIVKVGSITNLSDARYCAGMGVEMLGFNVVAGHESFIDAKKYQETYEGNDRPVIFEKLNRK